MLNAVLISVFVSDVSTPIRIGLFSENNFDSIISGQFTETRTQPIFHEASPFLSVNCNFTLSFLETA